MSPIDDQSLRIDPVSADRHAEAFALVFSHLAARERAQQVETLLASVASGEVSPQGLLGAHRRRQPADRSLVGAVFSQLQPGKTAMVFAPRVVADEPTSTAVELLEATSDWLAGHHVRIAQAQLSADAQGDEAVLRAGGFDRLADLLYLVAAEDEFPAHPPQSPLEFEPYSVANHRRLARIVEATYRQTRDCPQLDGVRRIEDVLAGYRATGEFDPPRWLIVRHRGKDVGCLLLTDHPEHDNWELIYMGVAAAYRGHGWGMDIARHAQWLTGRAGRPRLVLAVDAENDPAIEMYAAVGFRAWERRRVCLKVFS